MKKEEIHKRLLHELTSRKYRLEQAWKDLLESNQQEGKSSAGDKHETAASMVHLEMEQLGKQLEELKRQVEEVVRWSPENVILDHRVVMGSLVETTTGLYYMLTGYGKLEVEGKEVYVIGPASPMGRVLMGKIAGDRFEWGRVMGVIGSIE
jgi:transcription elongation GreA/GreB family factor